MAFLDLGEGLFSLSGFDILMDAQCWRHRAPEFSGGVKSCNHRLIIWVALNSGPFVGPFYKGAVLHWPPPPPNKNKKSTLI